MHMGTNPLGGFYDDVAEGDEMTSIGRTVTETDVTTYANTTGCWLPIHTDAEFAQQTQYGERLVQGTFLLGLAEGLLYTNEPTGVRANMGIERVEFKNPVFIDDTIHFEATVTDTQDRDSHSGIVTMDVTGFNQHDDPVVTYTARLLMITKAAAEAEPSTDQ